MSQATLFGYEPALLARFPSLRAGVVHVAGVANGASPSALLETARDVGRRVSGRLATTPIAELPSIRAWREVFHATGVKPTRYRVAVEALLRRLHRTGDIPSINLLVDLGNLVAVEHALPVAVFDRAALAGALQARFANGGERFVGMGAEAPSAPEPDEVVFVDGQGEVAARRWCWRQGAASAAGASTSEALFVIEAHHARAEEDVERACATLRDLLGRFAPGCRLVGTHRLSPANPCV